MHKETQAILAGFLSCISGIATAGNMMVGNEINAMVFGGCWMVSVCWLIAVRKHW